MILTDAEILQRLFEENPKRRLRVAPIANWKKQLQPASLDVRLGAELVVFRRELEGTHDLLSPSANETTLRLPQRLAVDPRRGFVVHPGDFVLATTFESVALPFDLAARLEGKSSWGRLGLQIHSTAGFVDPGFAGKLTFEISNMGGLPMRLYPGLLVAQLCFFVSAADAQKPYGRGANKYHCQLRTEPSRYYDDEEVKLFVRQRVKWQEGEEQ